MIPPTKNSLQISSTNKDTCPGCNSLKHIEVKTIAALGRQWENGCFGIMGIPKTYYCLDCKTRWRNHKEINDTLKITGLIRRMMRIK